MTLLAHSRTDADLLGLNGAVFSDCGRYRYQLWRTWDADAAEIAFVMLNPSTADALNDDPTIRRCIGFARAWGAGGIRIANLYALAATDPCELTATHQAHGDKSLVIGESADGLGPTVNDAHIAGVAAASDQIVAAWGAHHGPVDGRADAVLDLLRASGRPIVALGVTRDGHPRHPLYVPATASPIAYPQEVRT